MGQGDRRAALGRQLADDDLHRGRERDGDEGADDAEGRRADDDLAITKKPEMSAARPWIVGWST